MKRPHHTYDNAPPKYWLRAQNQIRMFIQSETDEEAWLWLLEFTKTSMERMSDSSIIELQSIIENQDGHIELAKAQLVLWHKALQLKPAAPNAPLLRQAVRRMVDLLTS